MFRMMHYILEDGKPKLETDMCAWSLWMAQNMSESGRRVDVTIEGSVGDETHLVRISTVFLGMDHNFMNFMGEKGGEYGKPLLWETMVFGGPKEVDGRCSRYDSLASAKAGHWKAVDMVKKSIGVTK